MNYYIKKCIKKYDSIIKNIVIICFLGMIISTFIGTVFRYIPFLPGLFWAGEVSRFFLIWSVLLISGLGIRRGTHLGLDYFINKLSPKLYKVIVTFGNLLILGFLLILFVYGLKLSMMNMEQLSSALRLPLGYIFFAIPLGSLIMIIEIIVKTYLIISGKVN